MTNENLKAERWTKNGVFGQTLVNVGDAKGLADAVKHIGVVVENDVLTPSLFVDLERKTSDIHMLIGSRRFSEGWNNYSASTLTLLDCEVARGH